MSYNSRKGVKRMSKAKIIDLSASLCLFIGCIIKIIKLFVDIHIAISIFADALICTALIPWFVVFKQTK